jgi:predicted 3-demethylubiquinone-9 3-methyltransferase (glyoxalase superfamily)
MTHHRITPCLWFDGQAKAAADFYCSLFPGSTITAENPMVANFTLAGQAFMALNGGPMYTPNPSLSFFVMCASAAELDTLWAALSGGGGSVMMPVDTYPWAERYGWAQDRFGVSWQLAYKLASPVEQRITPALMFTRAQAGKAEEAITFYCSVFGGSSVRLIDRYVAGDGDVVGTVKHAQFTLGSQAFIAMDSSFAHSFEFSEGLSLMVPCATQQEIDYYWERLSAGGSEGRCGWLKDKYGLSWQIVPAVLSSLLADPARSQRVVQAFLQMTKFDIEALMRA